MRKTQTIPNNKLYTYVSEQLNTSSDFASDGTSYAAIFITEKFNRVTTLRR